MRAYVTRDSVSAADDFEPSRALRFAISRDLSWEALVSLVRRSSELPSISGGQATWVLSSNLPLAVVAHQRSEPGMLFLLDSDRESLDVAGGEIRCHWSYMGQRDPDVVLEILQNLRLKALA